MWTYIVIAILLIALLIAEAGKRIRWQREYLADWQARSAGAFHATRSPVDGSRHHYYLRRIAEEVRSTSGRRAITVAHGGTGGTVVHEVNADGSFSKKDPCFIKMNPCIWELTGRRHLVDLEVEQRGYKTSNPAGGTAYERGRRIIEHDTERYAAVTFSTYGRSRDAVKRRQKSAGNAA